MLAIKKCAINYLDDGVITSKVVVGVIHHGSLGLEHGQHLRLERMGSCNENQMKLLNSMLVTCSNGGLQLLQGRAKACYICSVSVACSKEKKVAHIV